MKSKEYYQSFIAVINYAAEGHRTITLEKGEELAGNYRPRIYRVLCENKVGVGISGGEFDITQGQYMNPIYADCIHALEEIEKREADRELDNAVKRSNIRYAKRAYWISIGALIVAAFTLLWQIMQVIVQTK